MVKPLHNLGILWSPLLQDPAWLPDGQGLHRVPDTNDCFFFHTQFLSSLRDVLNHGLLHIQENICWCSMVNFWQLSATCWRHFSTASLTRSMPILLSRFSLCANITVSPTVPISIWVQIFQHPQEAFYYLHFV